MENNQNIYTIKHDGTIEQLSIEEYRDLGVPPQFRPFETIKAFIRRYSWISYYLLGIGLVWLAYTIFGWWAMLSDQFSHFLGSI